MMEHGIGRGIPMVPKDPNREIMQLLKELLRETRVNTACLRRLLGQMQQ